MHELSIAAHIVETLERDLAGESGRVVAVQLDVGVLAGVVPDALMFSWDVAAAGTRLEGSFLQIREIRAVVHCPPCGEDRDLPAIDEMRCPVCGAWDAGRVAGRELQIRAVEMAGAGAG